LVTEYAIDPTAAATPFGACAFYAFLAFLAFLFFFLAITASLVPAVGPELGSRLAG